MSAHSAAIERAHLRNLSMNPDGVKRRIHCDRCREFLSIGQFPVGSCVCIGCVPQVAGWRRGFV